MGFSRFVAHALLWHGGGVVGRDIQTGGYVLQNPRCGRRQTGRRRHRRPGGKEIVSVGRPLAGMAVEIRDDDGVALPDGQVGHIFVSGPSIMAGYFGRPDLTDQALHDGWLHTGDRGFIHDGELYVCGRQKDIVIVRGANHAPEEFEAALDGLPGVRTGCAVAVGFVPPGEEDEALAMLVETTPDATASFGTRGRIARSAAHRHQPRACRAAGTGNIAPNQQWKASPARGAHSMADRAVGSAQKGHGRKVVGPGGKRRTSPGSCSAGTTQQKQPVCRIEREGTIANVSSRSL